MLAKSNMYLNRIFVSKVDKLRERGSDRESERERERGRQEETQTECERRQAEKNGFVNVQVWYKNFLDK